MTYMKLVEIQGLTGLIKFDQWGIRNEFVLDLVELRRAGLEKVGSGGGRRAMQSPER